MIPANTQIWLVAGVTDLRRGFTGLSGFVQTTLEQNPLSGHVFLFRGRRGDLVEMLWHDGNGLCLFQKKLGRGLRPSEGNKFAKNGAQFSHNRRGA